MSDRAAAFTPSEVAPGLWRWTADHPEWRPGAPPGSAGDWPQAVGSTAVAVDGELAFIDALVPEDAAGFWAWADRLADRARRVHALSTISFHRRSRDALAERYRAASSRSRTGLPAGIEPVPLRGAGEVDFWLPRSRALAAGDRLLGAPGGGLRLCPPSWLKYLGDGVDLKRLRSLIRPLLELPVEIVLVSHGEPVLGRGREAIAEALR